MTTIKRTGGRLLIATLFTSTALGLAGVAEAAPLHRNWDGNGVDLVQGDYQLNFTEASIGPGAKGLSLNRVGNSFAPLNWDRVRLTITVANGVTTTRITLPDGSDAVFEGDTNLKGDGAVLKTNTSSGEKTLVLHGGEKLTFYYDTGNERFLKTFQDPGVIGITFTWDIDTSGSTPVRRLNRFVSNNGYSIEFTYQSNTQGNPGWVKRSGAQLKRDTTVVSTVGYAYPSSGTTDVTDAAGNVWRITDTSIKRPNESSPGFVINQSGGIVSAVTNDGVATDYSRTVSGDTVTLTISDPLNNDTVVVSNSAIDRITSVTDPLNRTTGFTYDNTGRLTRVTSPEGNYVEYTLDESNNATVTKHYPKPGSGESVQTYTSTYSTPSDCEFSSWCNKQLNVEDPAGNVTSYGYTAILGRLASVTYAAVNGIQSKITYTNSTAGVAGISQCQTASLGDCVGTADEVKTTIAYDAYHNPISVTKASGTGAVSAIGTMTYDPAGNLLTTDGPLSGTADTTRYRYDAARRLVGTVSSDPDGGSSLKHRAVRTAYDSAGQVTSVDSGTVNSHSDTDWAAFSTQQSVMLTRNSNQRVVKQALTTGGTTYAVSQASYDALGRVECEAVRNNSAIFGSLPTSACTLGTTGGAGPDQIARTTYDNAGQVTQVQTSYGTASQKTKAALTYTANGKAATLKDAENNLTTYEYDGHDRLKKTRYPVTTQSASASSTTDYEQLTYDSRGNVVSQRLRDGASIALTYDARNRVTLKNLPGSEPDVSFAYDNLNRLTSASQTGHALSFTYDALSRNLTQVGPQGTVTSEYDSAGRRTKVTYPGSGLYVNYDYLVTGEIDKIRENGATTGDGVLATYAYDVSGNQTLVTFGSGASQASTFDPVSRLATLTNNLYANTNDLSASYSYSPASQIVSRSISNKYAWTGAVAVNRGYTTNGRNQYTAAGPATFTYDGRGNLTGDGTSTFGYSSENLLTSGSGGVGLTYDPLTRLYQISGSATTRFAYDGLNMIAEYNASNVLQRRYVFAPGIDRPITWYEGSTISDTSRRFLSSDERGSIISVTDNNGAKLAINTYDEYGIPESTNTGRFQYTGQAWIPELGLYYYKARFYSPTLGRFMQTDPIGVAGGINLYGYTTNDPVNYVDPLGLKTCGYLTGSRVKKCGASLDAQAQKLGLIPVTMWAAEFDASGEGGGNRLMIGGGYWSCPNCGEAAPSINGEIVVTAPKYVWVAFPTGQSQWYFNGQSFAIDPLYRKPWWSDNFDRAAGAVFVAPLIFMGGAEVGIFAFDGASVGFTNFGNGTAWQWRLFGDFVKIRRDFNRPNNHFNIEIGRFNKHIDWGN